MSETEYSSSEESSSSSEDISKNDISELISKKKGAKKRGININSKLSFCIDNDVSLVVDNKPKDNNLKIDNKPKNTKKIINTPWTEKYRPTNIEDLVIDKQTHNKITRILAEKSMPNIIFSGNPGIGKTSTMLFIAKQLLGKYYNDAVIELNASDERGVKTVQDVIEYFCKKKINFDDGILRYKIVLLDEADNMTKKAQQFISKLMEEYYETTRFVFTCNNSIDIIETIQSRCVIFRYYKLQQEQICQKLKQICGKENIKYTNEGINTIAKISAGDLRQAINNLQFTHDGYTDVTPENVYKLCDTPHPVIIEQIFIACQNKDFKGALMVFIDLVNGGYSSSDISLSMIETLKNMDSTLIDEKTKIRYLDEICKACITISKGLNTSLQLTGVIASLCK